MKKDLIKIKIFYSLIEKKRQSKCLCKFFLATELNALQNSHNINFMLFFTLQDFKNCDMVTFAVTNRSA